MSITATVFESLKRVSENVTRVYQSGIAVGVKQAGEVVKNEFWDNILSGTNWQYKFCGSSWNDKTFYPPQDLVCGQYANQLFYLCGITDLAGRLRECGVKLDLSKASVRVDNMFNYATKLTTVPYLDVRACSKNGVLSCMFMDCHSLKTIEGIHLKEDGSQDLGGSNTFIRCHVLENVTFYGSIGSSLDFQSCAKLTKASIENIVEHLSDTASGQTLTMSKTARRNAFTDDEWNTLIATKPNWTFSVI